MTLRLVGAKEMKERFSKIFELWNRRNIGFYQESFYKIRTEDKISFNYISAIFPFSWLIFRKMYKWAMISVLIFGVIQTIALALFPKSISIISLVLFVIEFLCFGFFGNLIYYEDVKSKVSKGYTEIESYNPINPLWSVLWMILPYLVVSGFFTVIMISVLVIWNISPSDQTIIFVLNLLQLLLIAIPWVIDYKKFHSQESTEPKAVTEESINKYLDKANPKCMFMAMWIWISGLILVMFLSILSVSVTKAIGNKIKNQLDKIAVEIEEDSKKSKILSRKTNRVRKQLGNTSNKHVKVSDKPRVAKDSAVAIQNKSITPFNDIDKVQNNSKTSENDVDKLQTLSSNRENEVDEMQGYSEDLGRDAVEAQDGEEDISTSEVNENQNDSVNNVTEISNENISIDNVGEKAQNDSEISETDIESFSEDEVEALVDE